MNILQNYEYSESGNLFAGKLFPKLPDSSILGERDGRLLPAHPKHMPKAEKIKLIKLRIGKAEFSYG